MSHESCKHCAVQWKINIAPFMFVWDSKKSHIWQFMCCATFEDWHIYLSKVNLFYCVHSSYSVTLAFSQRKSSLIDGTMVCVWAKRFTIRQKMPCILNFTDYCTFLVFFLWYKIHQFPWCLCDPAVLDLVNIPRCWLLHEIDNFGECIMLHVSFLGHACQDSRKLKLTYRFIRTRMNAFFVCAEYITHATRIL